MDGIVRLPSAVRRAQNALENSATASPADESVNEDTAEIEVAPTAAPAPAAVTTPSNEKSPEEQAKYWEHRFKTLQGMSDAEKRRLSEQLTIQNDRLRALEDQLVQVERKVPKEYDLRQYLSDDELETLDASQIKAAVKVAVGASSEEISSQVKRHVDPLKEQLAQVNQSALSARKDAFFATLDNSVENWADINDDPGFHSWLGEEDAITGVVRQRALSEAESNLDARRVVKIFKAYIAANKTPEPIAPSRLVRQVQPDTVNGPSVVRDNDGPRFTRTQVKQFYRDVNSGRYRGREKERLEMERKIDIANLKGMIID